MVLSPKSYRQKSQLSASFHDYPLEGTYQNEREKDLAGVSIIESKLEVKLGLISCLWNNVEASTHGP